MNIPLAADLFIKFPVLHGVETFNGLSDAIAIQFARNHRAISIRAHRQIAECNEEV